MRRDGQIAVVTGAAGGIGAAVCERSAAAGARGPCARDWRLATACDLATAKEIAGPILLLSSDASSRLTCTVVGINGGARNYAEVMP